MKILDLEQQIMSCWGITDMLQQTEHNDALRIVYNNEFEKLFQTFEAVCKEYHEMRKKLDQ